MLKLTNIGIKQLKVIIYIRDSMLKLVWVYIFISLKEYIKTQLFVADGYVLYRSLVMYQEDIKKYK